MDTVQIDSKMESRNELDDSTDNKAETEVITPQKSSSEADESEIIPNSNCLKRPFEDEDLPKELKNMFEPLECKLCKVVVQSNVSAFTHYKGKIHQKRIEQYLREHSVNGDYVTPQKRPKKVYKPSVCEVCDVELTSEIQALQHMSGKSHLRRKMSNQVKPVKVPEAKPDPTGRFGIGVSFLEKELIESEKDTAPEPGVINQVEESTKAGENAFNCETCRVTMNSKSSYESHMNGSKHLRKSNLEKAANSDVLSKYRTPSNHFYCNSCNIYCNSGDQFKAHLVSKKHLKPKQLTF